MNLFTYVLFLISIPEQEEIKLNEEIMSTYFDDDDDPTVIPVAKRSPEFADFLIKKFLLGKSLKDWDKEKKQERDEATIIRLFEMGSSPDFISQALDIDLEQVNEVIGQYLKNKKKDKPNGKKTTK